MNPLTQKAVFNAAHLANQPPELASLMAMPTESAAEIQERLERAQELALKGFRIDGEIMSHGFSAFDVMAMRKLMGLTWVPDVLHPAIGQPGGPAMPGLGVLPGQIGAYDPLNMPSYGLKVSIDPSDFPPYESLPPAPSYLPTSPVGQRFTGTANLFGAVQPQASGWPDGETFTDATGTYLSHVYTGFGGLRVQYFEKTA